jgi:phosphoserine phosphatase
MKDNHQRFIVVRHGQTDWNLQERLQGQKDIPLNLHGQRQAKFAADCLHNHPITRAFSSSLSRAKETAQAILGDRPIQPELVPDLQEKSHGDWEGELESVIQQTDPVQFHLWKTNPLACRKPNGETLQQFQARVIPAWEKLVRNCSSDRNQTTLVVTHKFTIQVILCRISSLDLNHFWEFPQSNCAVNIIDYHNGVPHLKVKNLNIWESALIAD